MTNSNQREQNIGKLISGRLNQEFEEQILEAAQSVAEIDNVNSNIAFLKVQNRIQNENRFTLLLKTFSRVAAVLFIPLLVASGILFYQKLKVKGYQQQFAMQEITSPPGVRSHVVLPDGSKVWLNSESTIKFKVPFDPSKRDITLSGEAYFDVKKNPQSPFVVESGNVHVTVLGTKFNYKAYADENNIEVVLAEGKVSLNTLGVNKKELTMKPGERAVFDKTTNNTSITSEKIEKYIAWHSGKLVFDETPMPEVATQLERWFGIQVVIEDPKIKNYRITTTFENESLHQVLDLLELSSPIETNYILAKIDKATQTQTKSKIIISRKKLK